MRRLPLCLAVLLTFSAAPAASQDPAPQSAAGSVIERDGVPFAITGPPPPEAPEVVSRDASGRATVRAIRLTAPIRIDGILDEQVYEAVASMSNFVQSEPVENVPATERTEVWVFFDRDNVYIMGRCWESEPKRMIANEMQRDGTSIPQNEGFAFALDTFYDHRNSVFFELTPVGGRMDGQATSESSTNLSWNPVWQFATGRFEHGWSVETRIPLKSLRYGPGRMQVWGFNVRRRNQWKNENSYLVPIPRAFGAAGHFRAISLAATLVGLEVPPGSRNFEIKPYATSSLTTDNIARPPVSHDLAADWGADVKYGISQNLTADFTYNTDFAQVEADEQQVNLTRFSLFFPEKREFFLENQGTYEFGGVGGTVPNSAAVSAANVPILFYSRRIGLDSKGSVPILAGGRVTGRAGKFSLGILNIETDNVEGRVPKTNFAMMRVKRDVFRKSTIGVGFTNRSRTETGVGFNTAYGLDGSFRFFDSLAVNAFWAQTRSQDRESNDTSYRAQFDYSGDRYGLQLERLMVGRHFNPEMGFVRRAGIMRSFGQARFSPRPKRSKMLRKLSWIGSLEYIENSDGRVDTRQYVGEFDIDFHNTDKYQLKYIDTDEFLPGPLLLAPNAAVAIGGYAYRSVLTGYTFGQGRKFASGMVSIERGTFYDGDKTTLSVAQGRVTFPPHLSVQPTYSLNRVELAHAAFKTHLVGSRVNIAVTPRMFVAALLQYNSTARAISSNVRFRWEYQPGSELFVVFNEQRDTADARFPYLTSRSFIVKINRLFRF